MTGARPGGVGTPPRLFTLIALSGVAALSMNVFLPSLPGMARDFGVPYGVMQLSVSAYIGASAVVQLLAGPLSDRIGRRPVILGGLVIFLLATLGTLVVRDAGSSHVRLSSFSRVAMTRRRLRCRGSWMCAARMAGGRAFRRR